MWLEDKNIFADTDTFWDMIGSAKVYSQTLKIISRATDLPVAAPLVGCWPTLLCKQSMGSNMLLSPDLS